MQTVEVAIHFSRGYIADPYWPEIAALIDIQKKSGLNRAKSDANRRKALEEYLQNISMSLAEYEALEKRAAEPFYRDEAGMVVIPEGQIAGFISHTCQVARANNRVCDHDQVRSRFVITPWTTGKRTQDGIYTRFATVNSGGGKKLSNQRGLRNDPYISDFTANGVIGYDADFVDPKALRRTLEWGGQFIGLGACRKMGWGRFSVKAFVTQSADEPTKLAAE